MAGHSSSPSVSRIILGLIPGTLLLIFLLSSFKIFTLEQHDALMIIVGAFVYLAFWQLMKKVFWQPYLQLFEERERLTSGAEATAGSQRQEAKELIEQYEEKISAARIEAMQHKLQKVSEASRQASSILSRAENNAKDQILAGRKQLQENLEPLKKQLFENAEGMVEDSVKALKEAPRSPSGLSH